MLTTDTFTEGNLKDKHQENYRHIFQAASLFLSFHGSWVTQSITVLVPHLNIAAVTDNITFNFVPNNSKLNKSVLALAKSWVKVVSLLSVD